MLSSLSLACRRQRTTHFRKLLSHDRTHAFAVTIESVFQRLPDRQNRLLLSTQVQTATKQFSHQVLDAPKVVQEVETEDEVDFTVESVIENLERASKYNQGKGGRPTSSKRMWNVDFVRQTVEQYEQCLRYFCLQQEGETRGMAPISASPEIQKLLLSPETTENAFRAMLRCRVPTSMLSQKVREWERYIGSLGQTSLTEGLSLRMLEANGKAGNVGRAVSLLSVRKARGYPAKRSEFIFAITAIKAAGLYLRNDRNVFLPDNDQPQIDDPTRWLDAILLNMSQRDYVLTTPMANRMLNTYATTGRNGKALHYFYRVLRTPLEEEDENMDEVDEGASMGMARHHNRPVKVRLSMRPPPPYHKIPSQVRDKLVRKPGTEVKQLKLDRESDPDWSPPLTAAISFADSLTQGACGHDPIELDLISYSILIKACVNRGSLWRAMHLLDEVMPSNDIEPDVVAYNTLLTGLSRVGDVPTIREYFNKMLANDIEPTKETVEAVVSGLLNLGDVASAITVVQDCFNQYSVLPPYTTQLKILEFALGRSLIFEAKRQVYFIQQLWKWKRNEYHNDKFSEVVELTQKNPKLSKEALQKLFAYFGESLDDSDFL